MKRFYRAAVSSLGLLLLAAPGHAQLPPPPGPPPPGPPPPMSQTFPGFVSPYEVMRMVRASGFDPLSPPLRQGTTYVLRVTDFRGILMRVVVDGRTGAFREVSRIVPGPGRYGPPPYGAPPYGPPEYDAAMAVPPEAELEPPLARPAAVHPAPMPVAPPAAALVPPLPRRRPAALASRSDAKPPAIPQPTPSANAATKTEATANTSVPVSPPAGSVAAPSTAAPASGTATISKPASPPDGKPLVNSEVVTAPPPAAAAKKSAMPVEPLND